MITNPPLLLSLSCSDQSDTRASTIDSLLIQSHYFSKYGHTERRPFNHFAGLTS